MRGSRIYWTVNFWFWGLHVTGNSFSRLYDAGSLEMSAKVLSDFGLDPFSSELMLQLGLPSRIPGEVPVVQFEAPRIADFYGETLLVVAHEPWEKERFNRDDAIKAMATAWGRPDPAALAEGSWWSVVLERLEDRLI